MLAWSVVVTAPHQEIRASLEITRAGFDVFYPLRRYTRTSLNRPPEEVTGPLFPRYIFAQFDRDTAQWGKIRDLRGVTDILRNNNRPVIVQPGIVEAIRAYRPPEEPVDGKLEFQQGQRVKIVHGVLTGIEGLFKGSDRQRKRAFLEILGKRTDIPYDTIAAA